MSLTNQTIRLPFLSVPTFIAADSSYARPTKVWLVEKFWPWFKNQRMALGLSNWTRRNDCDNFARAYCQAAQDCHSLTRQADAEDAEGLAVGEFFYISPTGPHAIVVALTESGKTYIEPQTGRTLDLTPAQESTCFFVRF